MRIALGDKWKTVCLTREGLYKLLISFEQTNAPALFQQFINNIVCLFLNQFVTTYLNNIFIYSESIKEHRSYVLSVLERLSNVRLHLEALKYEFHKQNVKYFRLIVRKDGDNMDPDKEAVVNDWESPECTFDERSFVGFTNLYRRFVTGFSHIVRSLTALKGKRFKFIWFDEWQQA